MKWANLAVIILAAALAHACATAPDAETDIAGPEEVEVAEALTPPPSPPLPIVMPPAPPRRERPAVAYLRPDDLPGWAQDNHAAALAAYQSGCGLSRLPADQMACNRARNLGAADALTARYFFEDNFRVELLDGSGILTAYFAPEYEAREAPDAVFSAPVRPTPSDLRPGAAYASRAEIESRPPNGALAWMKPEDLFFLQIQGSGVLTFPDGRRVKASFDAHNSRPFSGIANPMRDRGLLPGNNTSGDAIRRWLAENRGPRAQEIMNINPRYVFFTLSPDDGVEPVGAAGIPLTAGHAIAVDPRHHAYGELVWIDAAAPILAGAFPAYQRLVTALDTGGAIQGPIRADLYLGKGDAAGAEAGRVRHDLRMYRLVPIGD